MVFKAERSVPIPNKDIISWTFDDVSYDVDKPVYVDAKDPSRSISAKQARVIIRKLVAGFRAAGLKKGDCVCISSFNDIMYPMVVLGTIAFGGIFTGTNPSYTQWELVHHLKASRAKFIISEPELLTTNLAAAKECGIPTSNILMFDVLKQELPAGFKSWETLMQHGEEDWVRFDDEKTSRNTTAARLFSSGTTGLPKAAILSHYNLIAEHTLVLEVRRKPWEQRRLICLPMFHAACVPIAHTSALRDGAVSYIMRRFELEAYLSNIQKYAVTDILMVPPIIIAIIMSPITKNYSLQSIKLALCGAAPLGKETQARFQLLLPKNAYCTQVWGMTEIACIGAMFDYDEDDRTGSIGRFLPNLDVKLIDDNGKDITAYDTPGELCIRGPTVISAYFENPTANASSFDSDGFFKTGDIVYCSSASKKWYVIDRKKELIKVRGFQVAPPELEAVLLSHPNIVDAAVIGITRPGDEEVELPRAYVVRRPGVEGITASALDEEAVKVWCRGKLAKYKELTGGVVFVDAIPKNASGKILKRVLREMVKKEEEEGEKEVVKAKL